MSKELKPLIDPNSLLAKIVGYRIVLHLAGNNSEQWIKPFWFFWLTWKTRSKWRTL